jgi:hypothetical protein
VWNLGREAAGQVEITEGKEVACQAESAQRWQM